MNHPLRRYVGPSVAWTSALTSLIVLVYNKVAPLPLTDAELAIVMFSLPVLLRAVEGRFTKHRG